jgi:protein gp37
MSEGCANCWHLRMANRLRGYYRNMPAERTNCYAKFQAYKGGDPWLNTKELAAPFSVKKPAVIGVQFMGDLFHESLTDEQIAAVFGVMAATPQHQYVVLTKRLNRALEWFNWVDSLRHPRYGKIEPSAECAFHLLRQAEPNGDGPIHCKYGPNPGANWPLSNVIMCASVENQPTVNERVPLLLQIPARCHGVSVEPMLGPIALDEINFKEDWLIDSLSIGAICNCAGHGHGVGDYCTKRIIRCNEGTRRIRLVICGAETGPGKRPLKDEWALDLRDQCKAASVPFFFKKDGSGKPTLCGVEYHEWVK